MIQAWSDEAWEDYRYWQENDKKTLQRIHRIINDIQRNQYTGIGKPEPLKHKFSGYWSRRIDHANRIPSIFASNIKLTK